MIFSIGAFAASILSIYLVRRIYTLKTHSTPIPVLMDWVVSLLHGVIVALFSGHEYLLFTYIILFQIVFVLLWTDAVLVHCFGMKVTLNTIRTFFQGVSTFGSEFKDTKQFLLRFPWIASILIINLLSNTLLSLNMHLSGPQSLPYALWITALIFCLTKSRLKPLKGLPWLVVVVAVYFGINFIASDLEINLNYYIQLIILIGSVASLSILACFFRKSPFVKINSIVLTVLRGSDIKLHKGQENNPEINKIILAMDTSVATGVESFGLCKDANIIVFTVESLAAHAVSDEQLTETLASIATTPVIAKRAYSISPNTNQALRQIYSSCYGVKPLQSLVPLLSVGYDTTFITTQDTGPFGMRDILFNAGFNRVIDVNDIQSERGEDYILLDKLPEIEDKLKQGMSYIHIMSGQTHSNYVVHDKRTFNRYSNMSRKGRYLNAVDESLFIIQSMLERLQPQGLLENTLVVLTGDHGQSFGEYGYHTHSSATIFQQVQIPFAMVHNSLISHKAERLTLLDLLPTLTELVGVDRTEQDVDGINFISHQKDALLLYSDTRSLHSPSNASVIYQGNKFYVDTVFNKRELFDEHDERQEKQLPQAMIETLVYKALQKYGLLD